MHCLLWSQSQTCVIENISGIRTISLKGLTPCTCSGKSKRIDFQHIKLVMVQIKGWNWLRGTGRWWFELELKSCQRCQRQRGVRSMNQHFFMAGSHRDYGKCHLKFVLAVKIARIPSSVNWCVLTAPFNIVFIVCTNMFDLLCNHVLLLSNYGKPRWIQTTAFTLSQRTWKAEKDSREILTRSCPPGCH